MEWLMFIFAIELGYNPEGSFIIWNQDEAEQKQMVDQTFYSQLEVN